MIDNFDRFGRALTSILRILPPELAHDIGLVAMERGFLKLLPPPTPPQLAVPLQVTIRGLGRLRHPIGLAAGFDKNGRCPAAFEHMGMSFIELGTVTPRPQPGNPKPRLFRYPETRSIINRMGFNSEGAEKVLRRLQELKWNTTRVPLGVNVGKNKNTANEQSIRDFVTGIEAFAPLSSWITINISSPNTPGLRSLATPEFLRDLAQSAGDLKKKCWIKLDPDMERKTFQKLIEVIGSLDVAGVIASNTHRVEWPQAGGQSGYPLLSPANACLEWIWEVSKGSIPVIASGGVLSGVDAFHKIARGASAIQIYTALVYRGPGAVFRICEELAQELKLRGFGSVEEAIGSCYA
jgi:dihydroorotate dehydrogenase